MELFEEMERVKIQFIAAYEKLLEQGKITDDEFDEIVDLIDRLDEYSAEELSAKLGRFRQL